MHAAARGRWRSALVPFLMLLGGCGRHGIAAPTGGSLVPPSKVVLHRNVELTTVQQRPLVYRVETIGLLEAENQTDIAAGVPGIVDQVYFREGDEVKEGSLLVTIDQNRYQADEELARANAERGKANLELARDLADRAERAGRGVSDEDRAKARGNLRISEAEHRSSLAALERARHNLTRSRVVAPYAGRINKRLVTKGSYLEEKTAVATIADLSRLRLVGYIPEAAAPVVRDLLKMQDDRLLAARLGLLLAAGPLAVPTLQCAGPVLVASDLASSGYDPEFETMALPGQVFAARLFYMSTVANPDTHMFESKAEILGWRHHQKPMPQLWPGFTARIRFPLRSDPQAAVIPEEAIRNTERGFIVFVPEERIQGGVSDWFARARVLELGYRGDGWVEVRQGLYPGERIVQRGAEALEDGTPIRFQ